MGEAYSLTLRNDTADVARMVTWVDDLVPVLGLSAKTTYALQLCLEEVVVNVVSYAFEPGATHDVHVVLSREGQTLQAEITDDGRPFNPLAQAEPKPPKDLASAQIGGLGLKLVRSFAGSIDYQRCDATNRLTLTFPAE
jgi:anti-sigma regulatory factor (Ser/Thr protein kinase)